MVAATKATQFTKDLIDGLHDFDAHTFRVAMSNAAPNAAHAVLASITQIANGNGYTTGGSTTACTTSTLAGVAKCAFIDVVYTSASAGMAAARSAHLYNDTSASDSVIQSYDYGSSFTLLVGETVTVDFDATNGVLTVT